MPPIDPPNHPHTHPWVGVFLQIINLQTELNYLDSVNIFKIFSVLIWPHPSTHPPNYTPTNGWRRLHRFQIFKQNWNISISSSAIEFWLITGVPLCGVGVGWMGWGWWEGTPTHMHAHVHMTSSGIPRHSPNGGCHLHEIIMFTTHACACMCTCVGDTPNHPIHPPPATPPPSTHPHPQSCREPKTPKFNNSWTNRDNSILFEDSLPLNTPELI